MDEVKYVQFSAWGQIIPHMITTKYTILSLPCIVCNIVFFRAQPTCLIRMVSSVPFWFLGYVRVVLGIIATWSKIVVIVKQHENNENY